MIHKTILVSLAAVAIAATSSSDGDGHKSAPVKGAKANTGYVTRTIEGGNTSYPCPTTSKRPNCAATIKVPSRFGAMFRAKQMLPPCSQRCTANPPLCSFCFPSLGVLG